MRRLMWVLLLAGTVACSKGGANPLSPSIGSEARNANVVAGANCNPPSWNSVKFYTDFTKVTITNASTCTNDFLFVIWRAGNGIEDYDHQTISQWVGVTLAPGAVKTLDLDDEAECMEFQHDVYFGVKSPTGVNLYNFIAQWSAHDGQTNVFYSETPGGKYTGTCGRPTPPSTPPPPPPCEGNCGNPPPPPPPPPVDPPAVCNDHDATNFGGPLPCQYPTPPPPPPPAPSCGPASFSGPFDINAGNGAPALLTTAQSYVPNVERIHPNHGGTFAGDNHGGFTFTPDSNYAVVIFHQTGGGGRGNQNQDRLYTGLTAGVPVTVRSNGGDIFYFNCPQ